MTDRDLEELAELFGVQTSFVDASGHDRAASPEAILRVLGALGAEIDGPGDVAAALRSEQLRRHRQVVEPVVAVRAGRLPPIAVALPRGVHPRDCWLTVEEEEGQVRRNRLMAVIGRPLGSGSLAGERIDRYEVGLGASPAFALPVGYHHLTLEGPGLRAASLIVVAPPCPEPPRGWGAFLPVHALRTEGDWGTGSFPALAELTRWITGLGGDFVGTLPLYPAFLGDGRDGPVEPSPYLPVSRLGWNELYVDPTVLPELAIAPEAKDLLGSAAFEAHLQAARGSFYVDYPAVMSLVRRALEPMARALFAAPSARRDQLEAFAKSRPELLAYARFRAAVGGISPTPTAATGPRNVAGAGNAAGAAGGLDGLEGEEARYHLYAQWVAEQQLSAAGDHLYLDLPIGVHPDGFDPWWEPGSFAEGVEGGAPPDGFFAAGQRWGFRPLHSRQIREDGYRYPIACLRHVMRHAAVVRIDHVMGLHRLYWVPSGFDAGEGVYVGYHQEEMRAVVALEAHRAGTAVVGEDLGTVPEEVRTGMARDRMLRSWVLQFEASAEDPLPTPPELAMASIGTHDLPRFATFLGGGDIDERASRGAQEAGWASEEQAQRWGWRRALGARAAGAERLGGTGGLGGTGEGVSEAAALRVCLDHMAAGPARLVLVDLEDLWGERRPQNRPGTGAAAGNWENRALRTLEEMQSEVTVTEALERVDLRRKGGPEQGQDAGSTQEEQKNGSTQKNEEAGR